MSRNFEFADFGQIEHALKHAPQPDTGAIAAAQARNGQLTKPPGSLGRLEELAIWYAGWSELERPTLEHPQTLVFAGNHGVTAQGISAFPPEVTAQMVGNFAAGGAAINQLCDVFGASLSVHSLDLDRPTNDFSTGPAMKQDECLAALTTGWESVDPSADLLVTGEMGIGNTTSAAAIALALFGGKAEGWVGRGTGLDDKGLRHKAEVVQKAVAINQPETPLEVLQMLGGRELAAMAGAILRARAERIPVLLDGFICCAAAAVLHQIDSTALAHCKAAHASAEAAHGRLLAKLGLDPILSLGMRLGEASGGVLAIGILKGAIACHSGMATFAQAGVAEKSE